MRTTRRSRRSIEREKKARVAKTIQAEPKQVEKIDKNLLIAEKLTKLASAILSEDDGEDMKFVEMKRELKTKLNKLPNNLGNKSLKIVAPQLGSTLSLSQTKVADLLQIILDLAGE